MAKEEALPVCDNDWHFPLLRQQLYNDDVVPEPHDDLSSDEDSSDEDLDSFSTEGSEDESSASDEDMLDEDQDSNEEEGDEAECSDIERQHTCKQAGWGPEKGT